MAMNESVKHLKRMLSAFRQYERAGDATGQSILMRPFKGTGKPPMIRSILQADR
jgi:hypothetical protein